MSHIRYFKSKANSEVFYKLYGDDKFLYFYNFKYEEWCFKNNIEKTISNYIPDMYVNEITEEECLSFIDSVKMLRELTA